MKYFVSSFIQIIAVFVLTQNSYGQEVIATSGGNFESQDYMLSWTLGELITSTLQGEDYVIMQGFQQPLLNITSIFEHQKLAQYFELFPNPVNENLSILNSGFTTNFTIALFNNMGEKVFTEEFIPGISMQNIAFNQFMPGVYFINISTTTGKIIKRSKIVKL